MMSFRMSTALSTAKSFLDNLNPEDVVYYRKEDYSYRVLVKNRYGLKQIFQDVEIHSADLEEIMLFYAKGEKLE